jgi:hypothetical protein
VPNLKKADCVDKIVAVATNLKNLVADGDASELVPPAWTVWQRS